jgi:hypothetical protein
VVHLVVRKNAVFDIKDALLHCLYWLDLACLLSVFDDGERSSLAMHT